jgi:alcohol dehydrogenase YqhD (iron-dependent ADH family)
MIRFAKNVFGVNTVEKGIKALEEFYKTINMPVRLSDLDIHPTDEDLGKMAEKCLFSPVGNFYKLKKTDITEIYKLSC